MTPEEIYKIRKEASHQYGGSLVLKLCDEYEGLLHLIDLGIEMRAAGYSDVKVERLKYPPQRMGGGK